jgi:hypothetical protein
MCPVHPAWQLKQAVRIDGEFYIDRACCFGSSASFAIFASVNSLIAWIAKNRRGISPLITYVDDSSGAAPSDDLAFYHPYQAHFPAPQVTLLSLWDELGVPHKQKKQVHGRVLPVIGIVVDPNALTLTLPDPARDRLITELLKWSSPSTIRFPLKRWQKLCGWINWTFNVFPLLRPCLNNVYPKIAGKTRRDQNVCLNTAVRSDFAWALRALEKLQPVQILESLVWSVDLADLVIYCDACPDGLGFWVPAENSGFYASSPFGEPPTIFYLEALCVLNALLFATQRMDPPRKLLLYTDNQNTVDIFSTLRCLPDYNGIVICSVDLRISARVDLRVLHVAGEDNIVADALSRADFTRALAVRPGLTLTQFQPFLPDAGSSSGILGPLALIAGGDSQ